LEEDMKLRGLVHSFGTKNWEEIARFMPSRSARQCRDRFKNYLGDFIVTNPWTSQEDAVVIRQYHLIGPKWVEIGKMLSGRSGNNVKNRWHKHLSKRECPRLPPGLFQVMSPNPSNVVEDNGGFSRPCAPAEGDHCEWHGLFESFDTAGSSKLFSFDEPLF
jgi:hypothetical protein